MTSRSIRIGCGSAGGIDRVDLAVDMVARGEVRYLCMDSLAERTLALAQLRRSSGSGPGYDPRLPAYAAQLLPLARQRGVTVIGNLGAADPAGALAYLQKHAAEFDLQGLKVAVIEGDDVLRQMKETDPLLVETGERLSALPHEVVSANAYLGYEPISEAIAQGAHLVIGGRIADSSLFLAPLVCEFGWGKDEWDLLGAGTCVGHLLECGTYLTGGNFADPPYTTVESFDSPSLPLADVQRDGSAVVRKLPESGGALGVLNCKLQLGYEIHDPGRHPTPDVMADFTQVRVADVPGGVAVSGATGRPRPEQLKVVMGVGEGFIGENQVSYAGLGALDRAKLAQGILEKRFAFIAGRHDVEEWRVDLLGVNAVHGARSLFDPAHPPYEVHVRGAARCASREAAEAIAAEVEYLMLFGPAGVAAGHRTRISKIVSTRTAFIDRHAVTPTVRLCEL